MFNFLKVRAQSLFLKDALGSSMRPMSSRLCILMKMELFAELLAKAKLTCKTCLETFSEPKVFCLKLAHLRVIQAMEELKGSSEVNNIPIGFFYEKSSSAGTPFLRILRQSSLKGMNASDRAPRGLFTIPDQPEQHFDKVQTAYNLLVKLSL